MIDLRAESHGGLIIITDPETGFFAIYDKTTAEPSTQTQTA
jgi:hypothetical protein